MTEMHRYFISFAHGNGYSAGFGWTTVTMPAPIRSGDDIKGIAADIEARGARQVTILNWRRFEEPEVEQ